MEDSISIEKSKARVKDGISSPITYYYNAALSLDGVIQYINVFQCLNDKFSGRILQPQFFVVAEETNRIYTLNKKLIEEAIKEARRKPDYMFCVQLSVKWFSDIEHENEINTLLACAPKNIILAINTESLTKEFDVKDKLNKIINDYGLKLLLDNPEEEKLSVLFDYKIDYLRLDGRYYEDKSSIKSAYLRIYADYARAQQIKVIMNHVSNEEELRFFKIAGLNFMEGKAIFPTKTKVAAITAPYELEEH